MPGPRLLATVAAVDAALTEGGCGADFGFGMSIAARAVAVRLGENRASYETAKCLFVCLVCREVKIGGTTVLIQLYLLNWRPEQRGKLQSNVSTDRK